MFILFLLFLAFNSLMFVGGIRLLSEGVIKKRIKKHLTKATKMFSRFSENKLIPVLQERNITNFIYQEDDITIEVAYNGKTIYTTVKADIYKEDDIQELYVFEYDIEKDFLIYTNRNSEIYKSRYLYEKMNPYFSSLRDKLIDIDWKAKAQETIEVGIQGSKRQTTSFFDHAELNSLKKKATLLVENKDLLNEEELVKLTDIITDIEKTFYFVMNLKGKDKEIYKTIIMEKTKEIDEELRGFTNLIEDRRYCTFKQRLKEDYDGE